VITLNNGVEIPQLGFGVFQVPPAEAQQIVEQAFAAGYRHIDTATAYQNEAGVGAAIAGSGLPREEIFVTTKVRNADQGYDRTLRAAELSRSLLQVDAIDLLLIHWPVPSRDTYVETWKALEKLLADGVVRAIGVSNFLPEHLERLLAETEIVPAVNQIEIHPTLQQADVAAFSRSKGIAPEAYSPLGRGADLTSDAVTSIAQTYGKSPAQVVIRWHLQNGTIVIPKSVTPERIAENFNVFDFTLTDDEIAAINGLEANNRTGAHPAEAAFPQTPDGTWPND